MKFAPFFLLYSTYLAGSSQDGGTALTTDAQGNIYVAGYTYSPDFPVTPGVVQTRNAGPNILTAFTALGAPFGPSYVALKILFWGPPAFRQLAKLPKPGRAA